MSGSNMNAESSMNMKSIMIRMARMDAIVACVHNENGEGEVLGNNGWSASAALSVLGRCCGARV